MKKRGVVGKSFWVASILALLLVLPSGVGATDRYWVGGYVDSGSGLEMWDFKPNWNTSPDGSGAEGVPQNGDTVYLNGDTYSSGSPGTVTYDSDAVDPNLSFLDIRAGAGKLMILDHSAGTLTLNSGSSLYVSATTGTNGYAAYNLSGTGILIKKITRSKSEPTAKATSIRTAGLFSWAAPCIWGTKSAAMASMTCRAEPWTAGMTQGRWKMTAFPRRSLRPGMVGSSSANGAAMAISTTPAARSISTT